MINYFYAWFKTAYVGGKLIREKIRLLERKAKALKKYITMSDTLWDALINNHVLSKFEALLFKVNCTMYNITISTQTAQSDKTTEIFVTILCFNIKIHVDIL